MKLLKLNNLILISSLIISSQSFGSLEIEKLHKELKEQHSKPQEYVDSKKFIFNSVDNRDGEVCSAYTPAECKNYHQSNNFNKAQGFKLNTEHTWPQSKGAKFFPAKGDMHHLYATSKESNSQRANFPFCHVVESFWEKQGSYQGFNQELEDCFEPVDSHKGNVARAMLYFAIRYKKTLTQKQEELFRAWNKSDPVDEFERVRNDRIEKIQGNRNPFIDDESLIDQIESISWQDN